MTKIRNIALLAILIAVACIQAQDGTEGPAVIKPSPALDSPQAEDPMPDKPTNAHPAKVAPPISQLVRQPGLRPQGTNGPINLQSVQPPPAMPTFADGVRLGFIVARRNQDINDMQAVLQYAIMFWNQEQQQTKAAAKP